VNQHVPVLRDQVLEQLAIRSDGYYVDCSFGRGGHSRAILAALGPHGRVLALDRDPDAIRVARELAAQDARLQPVHARFSQLAAIVAAEHGDTVDGLLADLGVSSPQLDDPARGFSFMRDGPLDMRMNPAQGESAAEWLNRADESEIAQVLRRYGEEPRAKRIARAVCRRRNARPYVRTGELAETIEQAVPRKPGRHPATRSFQAIRLYINNELDELDALLKQSLDVLKPGGRLCVISFHSLEDRRVKRFLRDNSRVDPALAALPVVPDEAQPSLRLPSRAIRADAAEIEANPRARSASLRVGERL
jgi:16S rRNA (cytosine1402-N4)-methyltransferase